MPDELPDYRTPSPDEGHEAIRAPLAEAIDNLAEQIQRIDDAFLLLLSTVNFADSTLRTVQAGQAAIARLTARLDALETPPPDPDSGDVPADDGAPTDLTGETP